jgi:ribonuclease HI
LTPIAIKIQDTSKFYQITKGNRREKVLVDRDMGIKYWHHPADTITFLTESNEAAGLIQIFTDGSKSEQRVRAGIATFRPGNHFKSLQYRLNKRCTNNQTEQLAILSALKYTENIKMEDKTATIYTDSQMTLDSLKSNTNHTFLIEEIRKKLAKMRTTNWTIEFCWVKAYVGIHGNVLADTLAKEAATNVDLIESYTKVPNIVVMSELSEISVETWQREWALTTKNEITKEYFPVVADRLSMNINITHLTTIITGQVT